VAPTLNFCDQPVRMTAVDRSTTMVAQGSGDYTFNLAKSAVGSLPNGQAGFATTIASGNSMDLVATLPGYNCHKPESWTWSGSNVQQMGSAWRSNAPSGISSSTNYTVTATEGWSGKSTSFTITVTPASAATVSVAPNPISLAPYARKRFTATTNATNPTFQWNSSGGGTLTSISGNTACLDAGALTSGTAQMIATVTNASGSPSASANVQFNSAGYNAHQPLLTISPTAGNRDLTVGFNLSAAQNDDCGTISVSWSKVSGPGSVSASGVYSPPGGNIASGTSLVVQAVRDGTSVV